MLTEEENRNEPENQNETRAEYKQPELAKGLEGEAYTGDARVLHPRGCSRLIHRCSRLTRQMRLEANTSMMLTDGESRDKQE
jgi:hypothetical protein